MVFLQSATRASELPTGYGAALLQSLLALLAVCVLAWVVLRWASKRGLALGGGKRVKVIERVSLDARRHLYLVEVGDKVLLLGAGDGASPRLLTEVDPASLPPNVESPTGASFKRVLARLGGPRGDDEEADEGATP